MSCKLLLNLVECIKARSEKENNVAVGRELLMRMNEVFVLKFKTVAKMQLPVLMAKHKAFQQQQQGQSQQPPSTPTTPGNSNLQIVQTYTKCFGHIVVFYRVKDSCLHPPEGVLGPIPPINFHIHMFEKMSSSFRILSWHISAFARFSVRDSDISAQWAKTTSSGSSGILLGFT